MAPDSAQAVRRSRPCAAMEDLTGTTGTFWITILIFQNGPMFHLAAPLGAAVPLDTGTSPCNGHLHVSLQNLTHTTFVVCICTVHESW